jgi:DNA-binding NarL/FixJ family response regulator
MPMKILIADDHRLFRDGLKNLLAKQEEFLVTGEAGDGVEVLAAARRLKPDIVLMDISMPGLNGIEATRQILSEVGGVRVVMLSMHSDRRFVIESLKAGAVGYLLKDSAFEELLLALRSVAANRVYLSRLVNDSVVTEYVSMVKRAPRSAFSLLTGRERQVLQLLAEGKTTKETAVYLGVSVKTIETHRKQIMDKLELHSVAELTKYAVREGLTTLE